MSYLNTHIALDQLREDAIEATQQIEKKKLMDLAGGGAGVQWASMGSDEGPRVLVVGGPDTGKTSLSKILLNYATKMDRRLLFVDLDSNQGSVTVPGTISATVVTRPLDVEEDLGFSPVTTTTTPLIYYYGYVTPTEKPRLYITLTKKLAGVVKKKIATDKDVKFSGAIIDTPSQFVEPSGYDLLINVIEAFEVTAILVLSNERLYSDLHRKFSDRISILKLAKSGGVVDRDKSFRRKQQVKKIREYFYGSGRFELNPYNNIVPFSDVWIRQVGEGTLAPSSALPIGMQNKILETRMVKVQPSSILLHSILAVSHTPIVKNSGLNDENRQWSEEETSALLDSNVAGFVYV
ncbi:hypothetical protein HK096_010478, partial [Nowakowskiella sp. JEL0078]